MYDTYSQIITDVIVGAEERAKPHGFRLSITGGSQQSCSTYFSLHRDRDDDDEGARQHLAVRISDHAARSGRDPVDYHVGLASDHGRTQIDMRPAYQRLICSFDEDDEVIDTKYLPCEEDDEDAELIGFEVDPGEIGRVAQAIVDAALEAEWE